VPTSQKQLPWVQALRAFAALSVAFVHIAHDDITNGGDPAGIFKAITKFMPWDAGVDIFFVISGFVIVHASAPLFSSRNGPAIFLRRRLSRIVPLYWIMTTAFVAILLLDPSDIHGDIGGSHYIIASYLFIPLPRPDGLLQPVYGLGWTLNFEMFFYFVFTPFLLLRRYPAVITTGSILCLFVAFGLFKGFTNVQLSYWSNSIILEFVAGMAIAQAFAGGIRLGTATRLGVVLLSIAGFHFATFAPPEWRALVFGLPATGLVLAAVLTDSPNVLNRSELLLVRLGDASYAMYLVHPFIMRFFTVLWHKFHVSNELGGTIYVLAGLLVAQLCAIGIHVTLERKIGAALRRGAGTLKYETV
jgi:peptidoglycan/LPS O-acetylase OafA/YrhL